jgi:hypothetical protein
VTSPLTAGLNIGAAVMPAALIQALNAATRQTTAPHGRATQAPWGFMKIYAGMSGRDRVAVLLRLLGGERRILLLRCDIES